MTKSVWVFQCDAFNGLEVFTAAKAALAYASRMIHYGYDAETGREGILPDLVELIARGYHYGSFKCRESEIVTRFSIVNRTLKTGVH